jgi:hypothetical protein
MQAYWSVTGPSQGSCFLSNSRAEILSSESQVFSVKDGTTSLAIFSVLFGEGWGWQKIEFMTLDKIVMARFHGMHLLLGMSF